MEPLIVISSFLTSKMTFADLRILVWIKNVRNESVMLKISILYEFSSSFMINHIKNWCFHDALYIATLIETPYNDDFHTLYS